MATQPIEQQQLVLKERQPSAIEINRWHSPEQVKARIAHIHRIYESLMQKDTHFGTIPGTQKPTLYKAGTEILLSTFRISIEPLVEDLSTPDEARYRVKCMAYSEAGEFLGAGIGEASSSEAKYKWRRAICEEEWQEFDKEGRARKKYKERRNGGAPYAEMQVRQDPADVANTVLKMAKKRAQVDVTLTVTACSDIFTQDVEDDDIEAAAKATEPPDEFVDPRKPVTTEDFNPEELMSKCAKHGLHKGDSCPKCEEERNPKPEAPKAPQAAPTAQTAPPPPPRKDVQKISDGQAKRFYALWNQSGLTRNEVTAFLKRRWNITTDRDIPLADYEEAMKFAENGF